VLWTRFSLNSSSLASLALLKISAKNSSSSYSDSEESEESDASLVKNNWCIRSGKDGTGCFLDERRLLGGSGDFSLSFRFFCSPSIAPRSSIFTPSTLFVSAETKPPSVSFSCPEKDKLLNSEVEELSLESLL
jgi:hypothetical protein